MPKTLTASIVLYKNDNSILQTIDNFLDATTNSVLYLIDNSPTNELENIAEKYASTNRVIYHFNNKNIGFGAAHNIAFKKVIDTSVYHLILNPDIQFENNVLQELESYMNLNNDVGLVMPKIIYPNNDIQYVCKLLPTPADLFFKRFMPNAFIEKRINKFQLKFTNYNQEMDVPYLSGCFMFLRIEAIKKCGMFDEQFFMYPEDIDLTRRIHRHYKTKFYPKVSVVHFHEQGSYKSFKLFYIHITNMIKYFNKWGWLFDKERDEVNKKIMQQFSK